MKTIIKNRPLILLLTILGCRFFSIAQYAGFSISNDINLQGNFAKNQRYIGVGHSVTGNIHITPKHTVYATFANFFNSRFSNQLTATAKVPTTTPQSIGFKNRAKIKQGHFSVGFKKYFRGEAEMESGWAIYGMAGLGLMSGRVSNTHSIEIDSSNYNMPVLAGEGKFKRLTVDLGGGWEKILGGDLYFYSELKAWIPVTDYPSRYLLTNSRAPFPLMLSAGLRLFF